MDDPVPQRMEPFRERNGSSVAAQKDEIRKHIKDLLSGDFQVRSESVSVLEKYGEDAAEALVTALMTKSIPSQAVSTISAALEGLGKRSLSPLVSAMTHVSELRTPEEAYLLENLIETLGRIRDRRAAEPLLDQLGKLNRAIKRNHSRVLVDACVSARVRIHRILSDLGERGALDDLQQLLGDGRSRIRDGIVQSVARVGDRRALVPLLRLHEIEQKVSFAGAQLIREAFRELMRREHVTGEDVVFRGLTPEERSALDRLVPRTKSGAVNGNGNGR